MRISVWAPLAQTVWVYVVGGGEYVLLPDPGRPGWYADDIAEVTHGVDYRLVLDDDEPLPDPRARHLPLGVHGPARAWDPTAFGWTDAGWTGHSLHDAAVVYELHVGTFTRSGTLDSAIERLDHLVTLGVTHVELMPLAAFDGPRGWGYDGVTLESVHVPYGGPDGLCRFVDAAHGRGLAVLVDVVHNHLGPSGNRWPKFGPFMTDAHRTPWGDAVNLDHEGSDDVRAILLSTATGLIRDFHLDGLRLDAVHEFRDDRARTYLEELADTVADLSTELGRPLTLVAESDRNDPRTVRPTAAGGLGMTAQWDDDVHHALHWLLTGEARATTPTSPRARRRHMLSSTASTTTGGGRPSAAVRTAGRSTGRPPTRGVWWWRCRRTTRWATGRRGSGSARSSATTCWPPGPRCCCPSRTPRCCSWARSGGPRPRGGSSPRSPARSSATR